MTRIEGPVVANKEIEAIRSTLEEEAGTLRELFLPGIRIALIVSAALCLLQGWSGGTAVNFYAPLIFQKAGAGGASGAIGMTFLLNVSSLVFTTVALFLVDVAGRRPLLWRARRAWRLTQVSWDSASIGTCRGNTRWSRVFFNMFYQTSLRPWPG